MGKLDSALSMASRMREPAPQPAPAPQHSAESALSAVLISLIQSQMERQASDVTNKDLSGSLSTVAGELKADLGAASTKVEAVTAKLEHLETCVTDLVAEIHKVDSSAGDIRKDVSAIADAVIAGVKKSIKVPELPDLSPLVSAVEALSSRETPDYSAQLKAIQKAVTAAKKPEQWVFDIQRDGRGITKVIATKG